MFPLTDGKQCYFGAFSVPGADTFPRTCECVSVLCSRTRAWVCGLTLGPPPCRRSRPQREAPGLLGSSPPRTALPHKTTLPPPPQLYPHGSPLLSLPLPPQHCHTKLSHFQTLFLAPWHRAFPLPVPRWQPGVDLACDAISEQSGLVWERSVLVCELPGDRSLPAEMRVTELSLQRGWAHRTHLRGEPRQGSAGGGHREARGSRCAGSLTDTGRAGFPSRGAALTTGQIWWRPKCLSASRPAAGVCV